MGLIHRTAIVHCDAKLHPSVTVGPYSIIDANVEIGKGCRVESNARIFEGTHMGCNNRIFHGAVIGCEPHDLAFEPVKSCTLKIGHGNHFKEGTNVSRGAKTEDGTIIGDNNYFMGNFHVGHDCVIGNGNVLGHGTVLAGHVSIGDHTFVSGGAAIHQFTFIGDLAMIAGCAKIVKDIPPYTIGDGNPARIRGLNVIGLRRKGYPVAVRSAIKRAYKIIYSSKTTIDQTLKQIKQTEPIIEVCTISDFYERSVRGVTAHRQPILPTRPVSSHTVTRQIFE